MPLRLRCWVTVELIVPRHCDEFGKVWICLDSSLAASNSVWLLHQAMIWFGFWKLGCKSSQWTLYRWGVAPPGCTVLEVFMLLSTSEKRHHMFSCKTPASGTLRIFQIFWLRFWVFSYSCISRVFVSPCFSWKVFQNIASGPACKRVPRQSALQQEGTQGIVPWKCWKVKDFNV